MMTKSMFLASALAACTVSQTTSVMNLFLYAAGLDNVTLHGSVISAGPDATTYSLTSVGDADCTLECGPDAMERTWVNGPSTFARHFTQADSLTIDFECKVSDRTDADCEGTMQGPSAEGSYQTGVYVWATTSLTPVTITAGLEKILAVSTATSGTAQTAASVSSGASETGVSASATSSGSAASASTTASSTAPGANQNIILAALCGVAAMVLGL